MLLRNTWLAVFAISLCSPAAALAPAEPLHAADRVIDVVVANQGDLAHLGMGEFNQLLTNRGNNRFSVKRLPPGPKGIVRDLVTGAITFRAGWPTTAAAVALADVDGDGDLDVFVANHGFLDPDIYTIRTGESNVLLTNKGHCHFAAKALDPPGLARNNTSVAAGDLDNDGDIDFLVGGDGNPVRMYKNDGRGNFTVTNVTVAADSVGLYAAFGRKTAAPLRSLHVALGDLNGDGWLDALVANDGDPDQVLINNRNGTFTVTDIEPLLVGETIYLDTESVAIADLDRDGDLDALFVFDGDGAVVALNDGFGNFALQPVAGTEGSHSKDVAIGDFDGDGDFDAFVVNTSLADGVTVEFPQLLRNNGNGTFQVSTPYGGARATRGETVVAADFDGDGDLDILIGNVTISGVDTPLESNYLLRNDGLDRAGNVILTAVEVPGGPRVTDGFAAGDVSNRGSAPATKNGLPNINPRGLLPKRFPRHR